MNINKLFEQKVIENAINQNNDEYVNFSYRSSHKNSAMIEVITTVLDTSVNSLFTEGISESIAELVTKDINNIPVLESFLNENPNYKHDNSFLKKLFDEKVIIESYDFDTQKEN